MTASHRHFGQAQCNCPENCDCHEPVAVVAPKDAVSRELAAAMAETRELRNTLAVIRNALRDAPTAHVARREALALLKAAGLEDGAS